MSNQHSNLRYPDFLIIGAMKSGTTTLAFDLETHPQITFPGGKEVGDLVSQDILTDEGRMNYGNVFSETPKEILVGDADPRYTYKKSVDTARNALQICGKDLKLIYIMRNPIKRAISHHTHFYQRGACSADASKELLADDLYVDFSRYAYQIQFWLEHFDRKNFLFLQFEDYVSDRKAGYERVVRHLGLEPQPDFLNETILNQAKDKRLPTVAHRLPGPLVRKLRSIAPRALPKPILETFKKLVSRPAPPPPKAPNKETLRQLACRFSPDLEQLKSLLGEEMPHWDIEKTIEELCQGDQKS
ncbi:MAG: hypothetical protein CL917_11070 [Deltaproteobacteria bacterium]|nr:hypothetical protein [Deltaproteobacteria bacterium]